MNLPETTQIRDGIVAQPHLLHTPEVSPDDGLKGLDVVACEEDRPEPGEPDVPDLCNDVFLRTPRLIMNKVLIDNLDAFHSPILP